MKIAEMALRCARTNLHENLQKGTSGGGGRRMQEYQTRLAQLEYMFTK